MNNITKPSTQEPVPRTLIVAFMIDLQAPGCCGHAPPVISGAVQCGPNTFLTLLLAVSSSAQLFGGLQKIVTSTRTVSAAVNFGATLYRFASPGANGPIVRRSSIVQLRFATHWLGFGGVLAGLYRAYPVFEPGEAA